jgi:hypothetical protein
MTIQGKINSTEAANNLLQRPIKKKDSLTKDSIETTDLYGATEAAVLLPLCLFIFLQRRTAWLFSLLSSINLTNQPGTIFQVNPCNHLYQRISRLQI